MWLAERLMNAGVRVAILTRGYGRVRGGLRIVDPGDKWENVGDEPILMVSKLEGAVVAVSNDRFAAGTRVLEYGEVDLFLLDDGYQHYALKRDLDIVVIDDQRRFGNCRLLPAGILREPVSRLKDADLIIVTKAQCADLEFEQYLRGHTTAQIFWADYQPMMLSPVEPSELASRKGETGGPFVAFCGIAGPEGFSDSLARAGIEVVELLAFPDHHPFSVSDIESIMEAAVRHQAAALVTTEKDAVRWPNRKLPLPVYALPVQPVIEDEDQVVDKILNLVWNVQGSA
jgi:tetraacyldisaccharide 4'-kinase